MLPALALASCSKGGGPVEDLKSLFEVLGNPAVSPSRLSTQVYAALDEESRAAVDARAKAIGERLGAKVDGDEILQVRGLLAGARVTRVEAISRDEERATLEVSFAPIMFTPVAGVESKVAATTPPTTVPAASPSSAAAGVPAEAAPGATAAVSPMRFEVVKQSGKWRIAFRELARFVSSQPIDAAVVGGAR